MSLIPYTNIQSVHEMKPSCRCEIYPQSEAAAISETAQRGCVIMDSAAISIQVNTFAIYLMSKHQCALYKWMRLGFILHRRVLILKSDGVSLAAEGTAITWNICHRRSFCHLTFFYEIPLYHKYYRCTNADSNISRTLSRVGNVMIPTKINRTADAAFSQYIG